MESISLKINGMKCTGCSQRVEKALKNTEGIEKVNVNFDSRNAEIKYNKETVSIKEIKEVITDIGFEVEE